MSRQKDRHFIQCMFGLSTKDFSITDTNNISPNILITEYNHSSNVLNAYACRQSTNTDTNTDRLRIADNDSINCKNRKLYPEILIKCKDHSKRIRNLFKIIVFLS